MGLFDNVAPELMNKAKGCKTPQDLLALAKDEGYELSDDQLEAVSGGASWDDIKCDEYEDDIEQCDMDCRKYWTT